MPNRSVTGKCRLRPSVPIAKAPAVWKPSATTPVSSPRPWPPSWRFGFAASAADAVASASVACRSLHNATVQAGFNDQSTRPDVQRWQGLIDAYWRRLEGHLPELVQRVGQAFGAL